MNTFQRNNNSSSRSTYYYDINLYILSLVHIFLFFFFIFLSFLAFVIWLLQWLYIFKRISARKRWTMKKYIYQMFIDLSLCIVSNRINNRLFYDLCLFFSFWILIFSLRWCVHLYSLFSIISSTWFFESLFQFRYSHLRPIYVIIAWRLFSLIHSLLMNLLLFFIKEFTWSQLK